MLYAEKMYETDWKGNVMWANWGDDRTNDAAGMVCRAGCTCRSAPTRSILTRSP